mmetsp:Transcript_28792/g.42427  ORF Transcript_28792/g.42427 Transcript_28792/m.42427 type:complete len:85 (+) Transcript_28792:1197-1451(+)
MGSNLESNWKVNGTIIANLLICQLTRGYCTRRPPSQARPFVPFAKSPPPNSCRCVAQLLSCQVFQIAAVSLFRCLLGLDQISSS